MTILYGINNHWNAFGIILSTIPPNGRKIKIIQNIHDNIRPLAKIGGHAEGVTGLRDKLKLWNYKEVLNIQENLEYVNESINQLNLVPGGF